MKGVKVIDLTRMFAGPYCAMLFADMGAEVIKVEEPRIGDPTRRNLPIVNGESAYFMSVNRGKKSVVLDLKSDTDRQSLLKLIADADIVIENFRPGVMARLGLDYEILKGVNPRIILCSISGFGQTGPLRKKISFDLVNQSMAGTMAVTGEEGREPVRIGIPIGDLSGGIYGAVAVLAALRHRRKSGKGAAVDVALHDLLLAQLGAVAQRYLDDDQEPRPLGSSHVAYAPHGALPTKDGYLAVSVKTDEEWFDLLRAMGRDDLAVDVRFGSKTDRLVHRASLDAALSAAFQQRTTDEWITVLDSASVNVARICSIADALASRDAAERGSVFAFDHPTAGTFKTVGTALMVDGVHWRSPLPPPTHGAHTKSVLQAFADLVHPPAVHQAKVVAP